MDLKELLGDELYGKVSEALKGKGPEGKDIELVAKNTGEWIPKTKFDEINEQKNTYRGQADTLAGQLKELEKSAKGNDSLLQQIDAMKKEKDGLESRIKDISLTSAIKLAAVQAKSKDPEVIAMLVDKSKIELGEDGSVKGLDEVLKGIKESKSFLFEEAPAGSGANPANTGSGIKNPWAKDSFNLTEQGRLLRENPTLAQTLQAQGN